MWSPDWPEELAPTPAPEIDAHPPYTAEARAVVEEIARAYNARARRQQNPAEPWRPEPLDEAQVAYLVESVGNRSFEGAGEAAVLNTELAEDLLVSASAIGELAPVQLIRLLILARVISSRAGFSRKTASILRSYQRMTGEAVGVWRMAALVEAVKLESGLPDHAYLWSGHYCLWGDRDEIWRYFVKRLDVLEDALDGHVRARINQQESGSWETALWPAAPHCVDRAFDALDCFPRVPPPLKERLWKMAAGSAKTFRARAQRVMAKEPETFERVLGLLRGKAGAARSTAAIWLGDWGDKAAIDPLRQALAREKNDSCRDAMMTALEALGVPLDDILSPDQANAEAAKGMKSGVPAALAWMPMDSLPTVHWARGGDTVPVRTLHWWFVQAHRLKSPEPGALLRRQLLLVRPEDRAELGRVILQAWIDFDTMPMTLEQIRAKIKKTLPSWEQLSAWGIEVPTLSQIEDQLVGEPGGSAIPFKGLLAIPAVCGSPQVAEPAIRYIRHWYGVRAAQSKALVAMLGWVETPEAVQFLAATARGFRTKGIQKAAHQSLVALAERRCWTVEKLADHMVPDGGLDRAGRLELDFGKRSFVVELDPGFRLLVVDDKGKRLKDLPKPGSNDDPVRAEAARKEFLAAKKQVRAVVAEQSKRLFEAMCAGRIWSGEDWRRDLLEHPIVGRLCRRAVWRVEAGDAAFTVRPRGEGELIDAKGAVCPLPSGAQVSIAHDANTPPAEGWAWLSHFADYALEPLFGQFNRGLPAASELELAGDSIDDFEGHLIQAKSLEKAARKLGYRRGQALDGPEFYDYRKSYPTLDLDVLIEFSGAPIDGSAGGVVALESLRFWSSSQAAGGASALSDVPPILLIESFRDLREIAEAGEGFHPDWRARISQPE